MAARASGAPRDEMKAKERLSIEASRGLGGQWSIKAFLLEIKGFINIILRILFSGAL